MNDLPAEGRLQRLLRAARTDRGARVFVWAVWLLLFGVVLSYVQRFAFRLPVCDDWTMFVEPLTGIGEFRLERLWHQNNEHRLPLVWLILYPLAVLTNGAFRVENFLNAFALGGLAAVLIVIARRVRGRQCHSDAFFPLALLNLGLVDVFIGRLMFNHVLSAVLASLILTIFVLQRAPLGFGKTCLLGVLLLCLPLCGANGLPLVVLAAGWLIVAGGFGGEATRRLRACHFAVAGAALLLVGLYFVDFQSPAHHPPPEDLRSLLRTFAQCLSTSLLRWTPKYWPWYGLAAPAVLLATAVLAGWQVWRHSPERGRALALLLFLGSVVATAGAIAWGRAWIGPHAGVAPRYGMITVPALLCVYLTWLAYAPRSLGRWMERGLFAIFCLTAFLNAREALKVGHWLRKQEEAIVRALHEGAPPRALAQRGAGLFHAPELTPFITKQMTHLRDAGVSPFDALQVPQRWRRTWVDLSACDPLGMTWDGKKGSATAARPQLVFRLPEPQFVHALRIHCRWTNRPAGYDWIEVAWRERDQTDFSGKRQKVRYLVATGGAETSVLVWVHARLDEIRIAPDAGPFDFEIREMRLLYRDEEPVVASNAK